MKKLLAAIVALIPVFVLAQSVGQLRYDTVVVMKSGGNSNLKILDATRDSTGGVYYNAGGGLLRAKRTRMLNDTTFVIGGDTITIRAIGAGGGGGGGTPAGSTTELQWRNAGAFGASSFLTWNNSTNVLSNRHLQFTQDTASSLHKIIMIEGDTSVPNFTHALAHYFVNPDYPTQPNAVYEMGFNLDNSKPYYPKFRDAWEFRYQRFTAFPLEFERHFGAFTPVGTFDEIRPITFGYSWDGTAGYTQMKFDTYTLMSSAGDDLLTFSNTGNFTMRALTAGASLFKYFNMEDGKFLQYQIGSDGGITYTTSAGGYHEFQSKVVVAAPASENYPLTVNQTNNNGRGVQFNLSGATSYSVENLANSSSGTYATFANSNAGGSAHSALSLTANGGSTYFGMTVGGATTWLSGVDNADGDAYKVAKYTGAGIFDTAYLKISTAGIVSIKNMDSTSAASGGYLYRDAATGDVRLIAPPAGSGTVTGTGVANQLAVFTTASNIDESNFYTNGTEASVGATPETGYVFRMHGNVLVSGASAGLVLHDRTDLAPAWAFFADGDNFNIFDLVNSEIRWQALPTGVVSIPALGALAIGGTAMRDPSGKLDVIGNIYGTGSIHLEGPSSGYNVYRRDNNVLAHTIYSAAGAFSIFDSNLGQNVFNINTSGNISTGVWQATAIGTAYGGAPSGGSTGHVLTKNSGTNYDYSWAAPSGGSWGSITGTLSAQTDLNTALGLKSPIASPTFTGLVTTPLIKITSGSPGLGKFLMSDADGDASWEELEEVITAEVNTSSTTQTTLATISPVSGERGMLLITLSSVVTTTGDDGTNGYKIVRYKRNGAGTLSIIGTTDVVATESDNSGTWTVTVSGTDLLVRVTAGTTDPTVWNCTIVKQLSLSAL